MFSGRYGLIGAGAEINSSVVQPFNPLDKSPLVIVIACDAVADSTGLKPIKVIAIREILTVRSVIARGEDLDDLKEKNDYSDNLIDGITRRA